MPVVCPGCGLIVEGGADVCPACHHALRLQRDVTTEKRRWCGSCGSPIPEGLDACPECGMPVVGAFDSDADELLDSIRAEEERRLTKLEDSPSLISALPPLPTDGENSIPPHEYHERSRLLLGSALAALALIGSMTLGITKPWVTSPPPIQVREDADTSMDGFPGELSHLTSQDLSAEDDYQGEIAVQKAELEEAYRQMGALSGKLDDAYEKMKEYLALGQRRAGDDSTSRALELRDEAGRISEKIEGMALTAPDLSGLRERYRVLAGYLSGASQVLSQAWIKADQMKGSQEAVFLVRSVLEGEESYSFEEWMSLFKNAYSSME